MKNISAREVGDELKSYLEHLKGLAKEARARRDQDAEAIEIAVVNLSAAVEILTD